MNHQISKYVSWRPEPEAYAVGAFSISWKNQNIYCFPPFNIIPAVLQKNAYRQTGQRSRFMRH